MRTHRLVGRSELLSLLQSRAKMIGEMPPVYAPPAWSPKDMGVINHAEACVRDYDNSDPFAEARIRLYMLQGFDLPSQVLKDCKSATAIRAKQALESRFAGLEALKRKGDEDRAWNQYRAAQYLETN